MDVQPFSRRQRGVTMIEVLVAALVLSFGITSIGMMMLATLQNSRSTVQHARAVELAQDMVERIRSNATARAEYDTEKTAPADHQCFQEGIRCTPSQLAAHDLWHWSLLAAAPHSGLPSATFSISVDDSVTPLSHEIILRWIDGAPADDETFTDEYRLRVRL